jgi:two-component system, LytTR family, sensor kinase
MRRTVYWKIFFIPLLGVSVPFVCGIITYGLYSLPGIFASTFFFITACAVTWQGNLFLQRRARPILNRLHSPYAKTAAITAASALYATCAACLSLLVWYNVSNEVFSRSACLSFLLAAVSAVLIFTLAGEVFLLTRERDADVKLVNEMEEELAQAGLLALTSEMDPHFIFNSLNAMNHLILNNPMQAHLFNNNLASVFKYFLLNKNRKLIPIKDELDFIDNYFYLLQIRYENRLELMVDPGVSAGSVLIPPCALQVLIENAIKHNEFSERIPLHIKIVMNGQHVKVSNNIRPKPYAANSTNTGLKNLSSRFKLICRKDIMVENGPGLFTVKLPVIKAV